MSDFHVLISRHKVYYVIAHGYMWYIILDISHTFNILTKFPYWILGGHLCLLNMIKTILFNMDLRLHTFKRFIFKMLITFIFYFYFFCNLWKLILRMCYHYFLDGKKRVSHTVQRYFLIFCNAFSKFLDIIYSWYKLHFLQTIMKKNK